MSTHFKYFTIYFTPVKKKQKNKQKIKTQHVLNTTASLSMQHSTFKTKNKIEIIPSGKTLAERRRERDGEHTLTAEQVCV